MNYGMPINLISIILNYLEENIISQKNLGNKNMMWKMMKEYAWYSNKRKAYKYLNLTTHKVIESAHVKIDEFVEKSEEKSRKEPKNYRIFVYFEPDTLLEIKENTIGN